MQINKGKLLLTIHKEWIINKSFYSILFVLIICSFFIEADKTPTSKFNSIIRNIDSLYNLYDSVYRYSFALEEYYKITKFTINLSVIKSFNEAMIIKKQADSLIKCAKLIDSSYNYTMNVKRDSIISKIDSLYSLYDSTYRLSFNLEDNYEITYPAINPKGFKFLNEAKSFKRQADRLIKNTKAVDSNFFYIKKEIRDSLNNLIGKNVDSIYKALLIEQIRILESRKRPLWGKCILSNNFNWFITDVY